MSDTLLDARCEAITETAEAILKAAGNSLMRHGNDPASDKILLAALAMAVELAQLLEANPGFDAWYRRRAEARKSPKATCPNCNGTRRATYFSEQGWKHEERDCHLCALPSTHPEPGQ